MFRVKTQFRWEPSQISHEVNNKPSETVPDMAMPLKDMIQRYTRGQPIELYKPIYDDDLPVELQGIDLAKMSKLEILELRNAVRQNIITLQDALQNQQEGRKPMEDAPEPVEGENVNPISEKDVSLPE